jgi:competence protein ComEC
MARVLRRLARVSPDVSRSKDPRVLDVADRQPPRAASLDRAVGGIAPRGLDPRDPVFWIACATFAGGAVAESPVAASAGALVALVALRRLALLGSGAVSIIVAALLLGGLRGRAELREAKASYDRAVAFLPAPTRCFAEGKVCSSPVSRGGSFSADVALDHGECEGRTLVRPFVARLHGLPIDVVRGDRLEVAVTLAPVHLFRNDGSGDAFVTIARTGVVASGAVESASVVARGTGFGAVIDRARRSVRRRIEATYHPSVEALGRALVLGEADLDPDDDAAFRTTGLSHLLAVSGTHLALAVLTFAAAARALLLRVRAIAERVVVERWVSAVAVPLAWIYGDFAGGSGSVVRSAAMLTAALTTRALGRRVDTGRAVGVALLAGALVDPLVALDPSFALSLAATIGLMTIGARLGELGELGGGRSTATVGMARRALRPIARGLGATLGATIACIPVLGAISPTLPVIGLVANLLAAPLGELVALPACFVHAAVSWSPPLERGAAAIASGALASVLGIARAGAATGLVVPVSPLTPWQIAALVGGVPWVWLGAARAKLVAAFATLTLLVGLERVERTQAAPSGELRVSALDVGQGDALLVDLPDGELMVIDGGGLVGSPVDTGERAVLPALRARRRTSVDIAVLSHPHPDHFTGLATVLESLPVKELWDTGQSDEDGPPLARRMVARARSRGTTVRRPEELCGAPRRAGGATIEILGPCPGPHLERGANDNSFVLRISFGSRSALLTGDAEREEEADLLLDATRLRADLLKVGHHGSRTSTSEAFLRAVSPEAAFVSAGVRNRFGHPHPSTLGKLDAAGVRTFRTDRGGEWRWSTDGSTIEIARAVDDP